MEVAAPHRDPPRRVVVVGGGFTGLVAAYRLTRPRDDGTPPRVWLVEEAARLGGKIVGEERDGFLLEGGPDSFVPYKPWARQLVEELGLGDRLQASDDARRGASVVCDGRLVPLPAGLQQIAPARWRPLLASPILSWRGKLRLALEPLVPTRTDDADESVADFVRRRCGEEVLERLAEPLLAHIHVADVERMSLAATYPRLAAAEKTGGLVRTARRNASPSPLPLFWTLRGGLGELVEALAARLPEETPRLGRRAVGLDRDGDAWRVVLDDGAPLVADAVVLATPAFAAAELVADVAPRLADRLRAFRYASVATVSLAYDAAEVPSTEVATEVATEVPGTTAELATEVPGTTAELAAEVPGTTGFGTTGFGFFVPRRGRRTVLAATWSSRKFTGRAPDGGVLLRVFVGGAGDEAAVDLPDDELLARVGKDLRRLVGVEAAPRFSRVFRFPRGYPQYDVGHRERVAAIEAALPAGLAIAGSAYYGVGLPDCARSANEVAEKLLCGPSFG